MPWQRQNPLTALTPNSASRIPVDEAQRGAVVAFHIRNADDSRSITYLQMFADSHDNDMQAVYMCCAPRCSVSVLVGERLATSLFVFLDAFEQVISCPFKHSSRHEVHGHIAACGRFTPRSFPEAHTICLLAHPLP